ncbi:MAG TPA: nucleotidyltransferase family protein [Terracidiphilus sp.]|nr:nucleotidyltransferase family protein [Terracidiphilus sp.]
MTVNEIRTVTGPVFERHGVAYAALFGSIARGEDRPESDVDILVRLGRRTGMVGYMRLLDDLEEALHKSVDLVTEQSLNMHLRPYVASDLATIYER